MGIITQGSLENFSIRSHVSLEYMGDQSIQNTLPNVVLIELQRPEQPPPSTAITGSGFWYIKAENFNIGASPVVSGIYPTTVWAQGNYGADFGGSQINDVALENFASSQFGAGWIAASMASNDDSFNIASLNDVGTPYNTPNSKGKWFNPTFMNYSVDNDGNDISDQALANWDYRVSDIMICDSYGAIDNQAPGIKEKNRVLVFVRLKDDWVYPGENVTIKVDINGYPEWVDMADLVGPGSDRRLKKNIKLIGKSLSGLKIYSFEYINKKFGEGFYQGVMSDEIPQRAVIKHSDGYDRVDYSKIDVDFKRVNYG